MTRPTASERTIEGRIAKLKNAADPTPLPAEDGSAIDQADAPEPDCLSGLACCSVFHGRTALQLLIEQAESSWSVPKVLGGALVWRWRDYAVGCYALPGGWLPLLPAVVLAAAPFFVLRFQKQRRLREFNRHLPEAIDLMSRALRAGHSLTAAIEIVGEECPEPVRTEFREVYRQQNFGLPARDALLQLAAAHAAAGAGLRGDGDAAAERDRRKPGGGAGPHHGRDSRAPAHPGRGPDLYRAGTSDGMDSSLLPIAMYFLLSLANRGYTRVLMEDPTGRKLVYAGLVLMVVGSLAIRKIVDVKV